MVGTGSFYKRLYNGYTWEEFHAAQREEMRVRTCDFCPADQVDWELKDDNYTHSSDWLNHTDQPIFHVKVPESKKLPNRTTCVLAIGKPPNNHYTTLPAAFAKHPEQRTEAQKISAERNEKKGPK